MMKFNSLQLMLKLFLVAVMGGSFTACVKAQKGDGLFDTKPGRETKVRVRGAGRDEVQTLNLDGYEPNLIRSGNISAERVADVSLMSKDALYSNRREYSMSLCGLQDMREGGVILGQKFNIYSELEVSTKDVVVSNGKKQNNTQIQSDSCIYWTVSVPYDHFAKSINLAVNFIFLSTQGKPTYIHKTMLINPWDADRKGNPELFDYTRFGLSPQMRSMRWAYGYDEIQKALKGKLELQNKKLEIGHVAIQALDTSKYLSGNNIGAVLNDDMKKLYEQRKKMSGVDPIQSLDLQLSIELKDLMVQVSDSLGRTSKQTLNSGHYRITAQLLAADSDYEGYYILTRPMIVSDERSWKSDEMGVKAIVPFSIVMRPTYGNIKLALRVEPTDIPGLGSFEALYDLGEFNQLAGAKSPLFSLSNYSMQDDTLQFNLEPYLKGAKNYTQWKGGFPELNVNESTLQKGYKRFKFTTLNVLFSRIMPGDTATDRTIQYTVETCVVDNFSYGRPDAGLKFRIETEDRGRKFYIDRQTNDQGCLTWVGMITHKYFRREELVKKVSKLEYLGKDDSNPVYELDYYINPWDEKFTFGRDSRNLPPEYIEQIAEQQKQAPATRLLMTDFHYDATGFRYDIDSYMNMTVKKTVLMNIKPKILKYNSIVWGRSGTSELRDGIYLLKVAMQKDFLDPAARGREIIRDDKGRFSVKSNEADVEKKQFLTIKEMLVRVMGGVIVTPIEFDVKDLRTLRIRQQMFIQLETIDERLLRVAALQAERVRELKSGLKGMDVESLAKLPDYTPEIINLLATDDEIKLALNKFKGQIDTDEAKKVLKDLQGKKDASLEKLKTLMANIDAETLKGIFDNYDMMRKLHQTDVSIENNELFQNTTALVQTLRNRIQAYNAEEFEKDRVDFAKDQGASCLAKKAELEKLGKRDQAKLYDPNPKNKPTSPTDDGALCFKALSLEELFYQPVNGNDFLADMQLKSLLTPQQYSLYMQNLLPDDLSNPIMPDYDFSTLSNQGDELSEGAPADVSGLPRRTFIGPVTFVLNGNGSALRPTDALDEAHCNNTCAMLGEVETSLRANAEEPQRVVRDLKLSANQAYEDSPYWGSVKHFYRKQVEDLIPLNRGLTYQYHQEMAAFSQIGNLAEQMMLDYTSFAAQPEDVRTLDYTCYTNWKSQMEQEYKKWRDSWKKHSETDNNKWQKSTELTFKAAPISDKCFMPSNRVISKDRFIKEGSNGLVDNAFVSKNILNSLKLPEVTEAQYKAFSKNGLVSPDLDLDTKVNILHRMCYVLRKNLVKNPKAYEKVFSERADKGMGGFSVLGLQVPIRATAIPAMISTLVRQLDSVENECHSIVDTFARDIRSLSPGLNESDRRALIMAKATQLPISVERKVRVLDTSGRYIYKDGKTVNYSVGTNFSLSNGMGVNRGYKIDPIETVEKTFGLVGLKGVAGVIGSAAGVLNFNWGMTESLSQSNGTSVSEGATLATQISTVDIELGRWEKCVVIKFGSKFFNDSVRKLGDYSGQASYYNPGEDVRGLGNMLCSGEADTKDDLNKGQKLRVRESYYYLTQIFNEGDMQDPQSLANHPWMLTLRGVRDFGVFQHALKLPNETEVTWGSGFSLAHDDITSLLTGYASSRYNDSSKMMVAQADEINKSLTMMAKAFSRALPTFPSMYTFPESMGSEVTNWDEGDTSTEK